MENKLDGNAIAGILQEIFPFEMTLAHTTCAGCGRSDVVGELSAYIHGMGAILRCPSCDRALIRVTHIKERYWLDMQGVSILQISAKGD
jgi:hypothetical protein